MLSHSHGHVTPNPDGTKARCGGPLVCSVCATEKAILEETKEREPVKSFSAWLVERPGGPQPAWLYASSTGFGWTSVANDATKFADRDSAERVRAIFGGDTFVSQHLWPDTPGTGRRRST